MRLDGIRVLDLTRLLPGPYATQLLADSGAEVVKIEDTAAGDYARRSEPKSSRGVGPIFEMVNRGKRSVAFDLKTEDGRRAFYDLVETADVVVEGFRPGVAERLQINYDALVEHNEALVYCSLSGYGQDGPWADRAGHDLNYIALSGLLDMTRDSADSKPQIPGYPIADMASGLFTAFAITDALLSRELGNTNGEYIDISMTDVVASFSQSIAYQAFTSDPTTPRPGETALTGKLPCYDSYETRDGKWVTLAALEPQFWRAFCEAVDKDHLIENHQAADPDVRSAVRTELEELFRERSRDEWETQLEEVDTAFAGVYSPSEAVSHPQIESRGIIERADSAPPRVGFPARSSEVLPKSDEELSGQGEHTDSYLAEVGYSDAEISDLRESDAVY
jgi:alpha-methylacyl-CoA racemase